MFSLLWKWVCLKIIEYQTRNMAHVTFYNNGGCFSCLMKIKELPPNTIFTGGFTKNHPCFLKEVE